MLEFEAYMTYHSYATGKRIKTIAKGDKPVKKKQFVTKSKGLTVLSEVALTKAEQIKLATKRSLIQTHSSYANSLGADEGTGSIPGVPDVPTYESDDEQISWKSSEEDDNDEVNVSEDDDDDNDDDGNNDDDDDDDDDADNQDAENQDDDEQKNSDNNGDDFIHPKFSTHDEEDKEEDSFDPRVQTPFHVKLSDDQDSDEEIQDANVEGDKMNEEETNEEAEVDALYRDVNFNLEGRDSEMTDAPQGQQQSSSASSGFVSNMLNPSPDTRIDSLFNLNTESTSLIDVLVTTFAEPPLLSATTLPPPPTPLITQLQQTPTKNFGNNFSEFNQTNQFAAAISSIPGIIDAYLANKMHEDIKTPIQLQSERLRDEAQVENADFLNKLDDNIKKIIKDQVKEQVKAQVSKILPKIKKTVNEQLKAEVLTRSSNKSKTSHTVSSNLSELELKKILIDKMESNKRRDDEDKDEEPFAGSNRGSKRRRAGKEPESTSAPKEKTSKTSGKSYEGLILTPELLTGPTFELMKGSCKSLVELEYLFEEVYKATTDQLDWNNPEGQQYPHDLRKPLPLVPNSQGRHVIPFDHFINNNLEYLSSSRKYATSVTKTKTADYGHIKWIEDLVLNRMESARDVYFKHRIIVVTKLEIVDWHNYKHLDWITVRRDDDKLYKFKEGDFNRLRIQDIDDMLLLLVQGKLTNLTVEERLAFNVSLRMFTRSVVIQRRVEDLQLGFSDGTLNDVQTALNDHLKGIRMEYLPQIIWRQSDKDKAGAMIQAIDKQLKTRRIMRSLEKFVGGRPYEGDF
ncbi:hypothetical protein Tco_1554354 [Tanacetum coccineum]